MLVNLGLPGHLDAQTDLFRQSRDKASRDNDTIGNDICSLAYYHIFFSSYPWFFDEPSETL